MLVNWPPAKTLPSAWSAIELILGDSPVTFGVKRIARPVAASSRADLAARLSAYGREKASHQDLAVRLHYDGIPDTAIRVRIENRVQRAVRIQPGDADARCP